jgi:hypothetical protein
MLWWTYNQVRGSGYNNIGSLFLCLQAYKGALMKWLTVLLFLVSCGSNDVVTTPVIERWEQPTPIATLAPTTPGI